MNRAPLTKEALGERASGKPVKVWFRDEARVGQQGTLTCIWTRRGGRPRAPRDRRFTWAYLFGAVVLPVALAQLWCCLPSTPKA